MNILYWILLLLLAVAIIFVAGQALYVKYKLEKPTYTVITTYDDFELREYKSYITASAVVPDDGRAMNSGFSLVADYIFGNNIKDGISQSVAMTAPVIDEFQGESQKISMTTPVVDTKQEGNTRKVSFVMPSSYTIETLPKPNNSRVIIEEVPAQRWAVSTYSGIATTEKKQIKYQELLALLEEQGIDNTGVWQAASYDPPSTLPFLRTNEIWIQVEG